MSKAPGDLATPAIRAAIQPASGSDYELLAQFGVSRDTVRNWRKRDSVFDASHTPHRLQTTQRCAGGVSAVFAQRAGAAAG